MVLTGPKNSAAYFEQIVRFIEGTLGAQALTRLKIIIGDEAAVARYMVTSFEQIREFRRRQNDSFNFNWLLHVPYDLQQPF